MKVCSKRCLLLLIGVLGCGAIHTPGSGVSPVASTSVGCSYEWIMAKAESLKVGLEYRYQYIPQVGWDACDLLAHNGVPSEVDRQTTEFSRSLSWWYHEADGDVHLVTLDYRPGKRTGSKWVVTYVGW